MMRPTAGSTSQVGRRRQPGKAKRPPETHSPEMQSLVVGPTRKVAGRLKSSA